MIANSSCLFIHIPLTAEGGIQWDADAAHAIVHILPKYLFSDVKKLICKSLIVQILLLLGDFMQLHWGLFFFFDLEDSTFVFAASLV